MPVRDISSRNKTEPYIEYGHEHGFEAEYVVGAENYCNRCYQNHIRAFIRSDRRYLILMTTPQNRSMARQLVGTMRKDEVIDQGDVQTVVGRTELYSFEDAIPASELGKHTGRSGHLFNEEEMATVLDHFEGCRDIAQVCVEEVLQLKSEHDQKVSAAGDTGNNC